MDKIEELVNKIKELSEDIEKLKAEKENEPWKPKGGEWYWYINNSGGGLTTVWHGDIGDKSRYALGNVFKTEEEAKFRTEQIKVEAELRRFSRKFVPNKGNYYLRYNPEIKIIYIDYLWRMQDGGMYFDTAEIARKAVETVGEERIKKYYFGVEE